MRKKGREYTRSLVRERDNYQCQDCGRIRTPKRAKKLDKRMFDVHHLNGLCGKKSHKYDRVSDMFNLITLCHKCHFNRPEHKSHNPTPRKSSLRKIERIRKLRGEGLTLREIGKRVKLTGERVRQILLVRKLSTG